MAEWVKELVTKLDGLSLSPESQGRGEQPSLWPLIVPAMVRTLNKQVNAGTTANGTNFVQHQGCP